VSLSRRPAVDGLYILDSAGRPSPLSSRCASCGARAFPARDVCEDCLSGELEVVPLGSAGTLHAFTIVHEPFGVGSLPPPYGVGLIEFEDGFQIRGLLDPSVKEWAVGHPVVTTEIVMDREGDTELLTYALTPGGTSNA
jgi:uncharacterized OB-fold protein